MTDEHIEDLARRIATLAWKGVPRGMRELASDNGVTPEEIAH
jgi:hypothetical protein